MASPKLTEVYARLLFTEAADLKKIKTPEDAIEQAKDLAMEVQASAAALHEYMDAQANDPTSESPAKSKLPDIVTKLDQMKEVADQIEKLAGSAESSAAEQEVAQVEANKPAGKTFGKV